MSDTSTTQELTAEAGHRGLDEELEILLADAKLVALFGQRTGQLQGGQLQAAIADVERKRNLSWADEEITKLQDALNSTVRMIAPVTLLDLRRGWNPFSRSRANSIKMSFKNSTFIIFAFLLIMAASVATFVLNTGNTILTALEELRVLEPQWRIGELQRQLLNAKLQDTSKSPESILAQEAYFRTLDDLRTIDQKLSLYDPLSETYHVEHQNPFVFAKNIVLAGIGITEEGQKNLYKSENVPCELAKSLRGNTVAVPFRDDGVGKMFSTYQLGALDLSCFQGLKYQPEMVPSIGERIGKVNRVVNLYALWILPAIYGALGATIFFMRSVLDPLVPDPLISRIALRVALGALSGIILGWFWTPDNAFGSEIAKIGFSLFALSFVAGFSIDVFFAMLDRFVSLGRSFFSQLGGKPVGA